MLLGTGDGYVHQQLVVEYYSSITFSEFITELRQIAFFELTESGAKDFYKHLVSYFFGGVLGLPQLFFPFVASVYGYFFGGSLLIVLRNLRTTEVNYVIAALIGVFVFVKGIEGFYTVRTWTGLWVLVYSCLRYYETRRKRYIVLMFVPPLIHLAYFILAIPAWIVLVFGTRPFLYAGLFLASSVTTILPTQEATDVLSRTDRGAAQVRSYLVEEQKETLQEFETLQESTNWYNAYRKAGLQRWAPTILIFAVFFAGIYTRVMQGAQRHIFSIGLLTLTLSNSTWFLYALHNRSFIVGTVFTLAGFLLTRLDPRNKHSFCGMSKGYRFALHASILFFVPLVIFHISLTLDRTSVFMLGLPFVAWVDPDLNISLKQVLNVLLGRG